MPLLHISNINTHTHTQRDRLHPSIIHTRQENRTECRQKRTHHRTDHRMSYPLSAVVSCMDNIFNDALFSDELWQQFFCLSLLLAYFGYDDDNDIYIHCKKNIQ